MGVIQVSTYCGFFCERPILFYISLVITAIAGLLNLITILSMTIPLLYKERRKQYSSYNLYLAFLSIFDLGIISCYLTLRVIKHFVDPSRWVFENQDGELVYDPPFDNSIFTGGLTANLYINAFIAYEIYNLLCNSNQIRHHNPPSILKVAIQGIISLIIGAIASILDAFLFDSHEMKENATTRVTILYLSCVSLFFIGIPISVLFYVFFRIWRDQLLQLKDLYEGRLHCLALYFAKILFADGFSCIISIIFFGMFVTLDRFNDPDNPARYIVAFIYVILSIITFALSMTKPDVYKLVMDFLWFRYCKCGLCSSCWQKFCCCCKNSQLHHHPHHHQQQQEQESDNSEDGMIVEGELSGLHFDHYLRTDRSIHRTNANFDNENNNNQINDNIINKTSSSSNEISSNGVSIEITCKEVDINKILPKS